MPSPTVPSNTPRLRTLDVAGMPIEINGVEFPVQSWDIAYGYPGQPVEVRLNLLVDFAAAEPEPTAEPIRSPKLAEAVHYVSHGAAGGEYGRECRAAIVTDTNDGNEDIFAGLCVLNPTGQFFNPRVMRDDRRGLWAHSNVPGYRGGTWHFAEDCQGAEDAPDADCCAVAPESEACAPAPDSSVHLVLSGFTANTTQDVEALVRKFAKKADAAGLSLTLG